MIVLSDPGHQVVAEEHEHGLDREDRHQQHGAGVELGDVLVGEGRIDDVAEERGVDQAQAAAHRQAGQRDRQDRPALR